MIKKSTILMLAIFVLLLTGDGLADAVFGEIFELRQPGGSTIEVRIWGDEFHQIVESLDGYTLIRDPITLEICYAILSDDGDTLISTGISAGLPLYSLSTVKKHIRPNSQAVRAQIKAARNKSPRGESGFLSAFADQPAKSTSTGRVKGICLLVDFPDEPNTISPADINDFCNKLEGYNAYGNHGSVREYFFDVSNGALDYTNYVLPVYYRAPENMGHYDDPSLDNEPPAQELILGALNWLDRQGFDFSDFDSDGDGKIDAINCFYAGSTSSGWGKGLWPHQGTITFSADGVEANVYQITGIGRTLSIGTFCHENGHMLCAWPDLYDYDYDSHGVGRYCLMGRSSELERTRPLQPCAYLKYRAGWAEVTPLTDPQSNLQLTAAANQFFIMNNPKVAGEFYMISNRQKSDWDLNLPDEGLAIWHIDELASNDNQQMTPALHYLVTLVQADGRWDLENYRNPGDRQDLFDAGSVNSCTPFTEPGTNWWAGNSSAMSIRNIGASGRTMFFDFSIDPSPPTAVDQAVVATSGEPVSISLTALDDYLPRQPGRLTFIITSLPANGTLEDPVSGIIGTADTQLADFGNTVVYRHRDGYLGPDSFSFKASDGGSSPAGGDSNEAVLSITVSLPFYVDDDAANDPGPGDPNVSDTLADGSAAHPFDSIQKAINSTRSTETIIVRSGTYTGEGNREIDFAGKSITIRSEEGADTCIIDCQGKGRGFYFHSGEAAQSVLDGLTIANGNSERGGGIYCTNASGPTIVNCTLRNNSAKWGGAMRNNKSNPVIKNCLFRDNSAAESGGGIQNYESNPAITDCTFTRNVSEFGGGLQNHTASNAVITNCQFVANEANAAGGAMENEYSNPEVTGCTFRQNSAKWGGGMRDMESNPTVVNSTFSENTAQHGGGGMQNFNSRPVLNNCRFTGNVAEVADNNYNSLGGGILNSGASNTTLTDCTFGDNSAEWGGGLFNSSSDPQVNNCEFIDNKAALAGGAITNEDQSSPVITGCRFTNNSAGWGGGVRNYQSFPVITNCLFIGNIAKNSGGAVQSQESNVRITNCTISGNSAPAAAAGGVYNNPGDSITTITNSILWANLGGQLYSNGGPDTDTIVTYSDIQGGWQGEGNIDAAPLFADAQNGDFHLKSQAGRWDPAAGGWTADNVTSPCIDNGDPAGSAELEPEPNGGRINMGAYGGTAEASKSYRP